MAPTLQVPGQPQRPTRLIAFLGGLFATLFMVVLVAAVGAGFTLFGGGPKAKQGDETIVMLRPGSGVSEIAGTLKRAGVIRSTGSFRIAAQVLGADRSLRAGEYRIESGASLSSIIRMLKTGSVVRHFVTVPEGRTSAMAVRILMAEPVLTGEVTIPPEGSILPETYEVTRGETRAAVLQRMTKARDEALAELWAKRAQGLPINTPEEAINLAAIVEKETSKADERPRVAAVYINRLRQGMPLAADPTIVYGISGGEPLGRGIRRSELDADTPWNSYKRAGLPPHPIANPGRASIAAVLNPAVTRELFFVADGTGGHAFAETGAQHDRNVLKWRQIEAARKARPEG
jgi:UPF0755 protein